MNALIQLTRSENVIDLNGSLYQAGDSFVPPPVVFSPIYSAGSSANRLTGSILIDRKYENREFSFSLIITGENVAVVDHAARDLQMFLLDAGDEVNPTMLEFRNNADTPEPSWGQVGANLRYEIVSGVLSLGESYGTASVRDRLVVLLDCRVQLLLKPFPEGRSQLCMDARGGIVEGDLGVAVTEATTNLFTNPVFGHATWDTGWTFGANLIYIQGDGLLPETENSALITALGSTLNTATQSLTLAASAHTIYAIVALPDGSEPDSDNVQIYYNGAAQTTTFIALGGGLYYAIAQVTGTGGAAATGIVVKIGHTVLLGAMQAEALSHHTPLCWGGLLGCTWNGTAHASSTTRVAGFLRREQVDNPILRFGQGSLRMVIRWEIANTYSAAMELFSAGGFLRAYFDPADDRVHLTDGVHTVDSSALVFSPGDMTVFHFVWSAAGMFLYTNGVLSDGDTYTAQEFTGYLYFGSDTTPAAHLQGYLTDVGAYEAAVLSTAQVLADYTMVLQVAVAGQRIGHVPWWWTQAGDGVVQNRNDSMGKHYAVCSGVPGSVDARTLIYGTLSEVFLTVHTLWFSKLSHDIFVDPTTMLFMDESGVAAADMCGGEYRSASVTPSNPDLLSTLTLTGFKRIEALLGKELFLFARLNDAGTTLTLGANVLYGLEQLTNDHLSASAADATFRLFKTNPITFFAPKRLFLSQNLKPYQAAIRLYGNRVTGSGAVHIDYMAVMPSPLMRFDLSDVSENDFVYEGREMYGLLNGLVTTQEELSGSDPIEVSPGQINHILMLLGDIAGTPTITRTLTYTRVYVTPRWALL